MASNQHYYEGVNHVVEVNSDIGTACKICDFWLDGAKEFTKSVNHYMTEHGYKLLHVGTQTTESSKGEPWHATIAIMGKKLTNTDKKALLQKEVPKISIKFKPGEPPTKGGSKSSR